MRAPEVQRARELCRTGIDAGHGGIVFVAGEPGSGRAAFLEELERTLRYEAAHLRVLRGAISEGTYTPASAPGDFARLLDLVNAALGLAGAALPIAGLLAQVMGFSRSAHELVREGPLAEGSATFDGLFQILRIGAREKPIVCLVDGCDAADGRWWSELLLGLAHEMQRDLPLFLFLVVDGHADPGEHVSGEADALLAARHLTSDGLADWWHFGAVGEQALRALTGSADRDTTLRLAELSEGHAAWAAELWDEWRRLGVVERDTDLGPWRFAPGQPDGAPTSVAKVVRRRIRAELGDGDAARLASELLGCAAVEGRHFTAEVVSTALERDAESVMDLLDDHLVKDDGRPHALVEFAGWYSVEQEDGSVRSLSRYRFTSHGFRSALLRYGVPDARRGDLTRAVAQAMEEHFGTGPHPFASTIARHYASCGDSARAREWREWASARMPPDAVMGQARELLSLDPESVGRPIVLRACHILVDASVLIWQTGPIADLLEFTEKAVVLARQARSPTLEARALHAQGNAEMTVGLPQAARSHLETACAIHRATGNSTHLAVVLADLAFLKGSTGDEDGAIEDFTEARELCRKVGSARGELQVVKLEANIYAHLDLNDRAADALARAEVLVGKVGTRRDVAALKNQRGILAYHAGDATSAIAYFREGIELYQQDGSPHLAGAPTIGLGMALALDGQLGDAERVLVESLVVAQAMDDAALEAQARSGLCRVYASTDRVGLAIAEGRQCAEVLRELGRLRSAADARAGIAALLLTAGDHDAARTELQSVLAEGERLGDEDITSRARTMLDALP